MSTDTLVISFHGLANDDLATAVVDQWRAIARPDPDHLVADLTGLTLVDPGAVEALLSGLHSVIGAGGQLCLVCSRLTGRSLLRRWGVDDVAIFSSTRDALQLKVHLEQGLGSGWTSQPGGAPSRLFRQTAPDGLGDHREPSAHGAGAVGERAGRASLGEAEDLLQRLTATYSVLRYSPGSPKVRAVDVGNQAALVSLAA